MEAREQWRGDWLTGGRVCTTRLCAINFALSRFFFFFEGAAIVKGTESIVNPSTILMVKYEFKKFQNLNVLALQKKTFRIGYIMLKIYYNFL